MFRGAKGIAFLKALMSATGSACNLSVRMRIADISSSRRARPDRQGTEICISTVGD